MSTNNGDRFELPDCFRRIEELLSGATTPQNFGSVDESVKEPNHDLKQQALEYDNNASVQGNRMLREPIKSYTEEAEEAENATYLQEIITELQANLAAEKEKREQLTAKLSGIASALAQLIDPPQSFGHEKNIEELQAKLDDAKKAVDWHRKEHTEMSTLCNALSSYFSSDERRIIIQQNHMLKQANKILEEKIRGQFQGIARFVIDLQLASKDMRVYVCSHDKYSNILPKSNKITRVKTAQMIVEDMYKHWADDTGFLIQYENAKQDIFRHHAAHEKAGHYKGKKVEEIKKIFKDPGQKRAAGITYL